MAISNSAKEFAYRVHAGQPRKDELVLDHLNRVASKFKDETLQAVAWLHDAVEDGISLDEIRWRFGTRISMIVDSISRRPNEKYMDYIVRVSKDSLATRVKLADLEDNMYNCTESLSKRYVAAHKFLSNQ